jgi:signal transduction histidine kinase
MRSYIVIGLLAVCVSCAPRESASPSDRGTPAEADAMLERAIAHYEKVGRTQALADFTAKQAPFVDRDLYVFCYGADRTIAGHGADPGLVGRNYDDLRDVDGKAFGTEIWNVGNRPGGGTVEYKWLNPVTRQVEPKVSTVRKVGEDVCGVGVYKP